MNMNVEKVGCAVLAEVLLQILLMGACLSSSPNNRHLALCCWIIPGRIAGVLLAFFFDYLPHRPHTHTGEADPYRATSVTSLFGENSDVLTPLLLGQNYHNIHHLAPFVPFYQYSTIWHAFKDELILKGTKIKSIF